MGEKKNNSGLELAPNPRREKFVTLSWHSVLLWTNVSVYTSETPTKSQGMLTHPLTLANPASESTGSSNCLSQPSASPDFCRLARSVHFSWLSFYSETFLPSSSSSLVGDLMRKPIAWVLRQNRQRDPLTGTHTHTHGNECHPSCHNKRTSGDHPNYSIVEIG